MNTFGWPMKELRKMWKIEVTIFSSYIIFWKERQLNKSYKRFKYSAETLCKVLNKITSGEMSLNEYGKTFSIQSSCLTLMQWLSKIYKYILKCREQMDIESQAEKTCENLEPNDYKTAEKICSTIMQFITEDGFQIYEWNV